MSWMAKKKEKLKKWIGKNQISAVSFTRKPHNSLLHLFLVVKRLPARKNGSLFRFPPIFVPFELLMQLISGEGIFPVI